MKKWVKSVKMTNKEGVFLDNIYVIWFLFKFYIYTIQGWYKLNHNCNFVCPVDGEPACDPRLAALLAVHLVSQILDEAYIIANAGNEPGNNGNLS